MRKATWLSAAVLLTACQPHETPQQMQARMEKETEGFRTAAVAVAKRWEGYVTSSQGDSIATLFTEQGREMPPNEPAVVGRAAIARYETANDAVFAGKLAIAGEEYMANGPLAIERGSFTFSGKAKSGAPKGTPASVTDEGKYLIHWHNVNGQWQIAEVIWNSNKPLMMAAPAAAAKKPAAHPKTTAKAPAKKM